MLYRADTWCTGSTANIGNGFWSPVVMHQPAPSSSSSQSTSEGGLHLSGFLHHSDNCKYLLLCAFASITPHHHLKSMDVKMEWSRFTDRLVSLGDPYTIMEIPRSLVIWGLRGGVSHFALTPVHVHGKCPKPYGMVMFYGQVGVFGGPLYY